MADETTTEMLAEIEGQPEPQPVQIREGRWRTRGGEVKYIKAGGSRRDNHYSWPWTDTLMCWQDSGFYHASKPSENDLVEYLGPIQPEPEVTITPDDVAAEALAGVNEWPSVQTLRQKMETTEAALLEQQQRNEQLVTQGSQQYMQIQELRSEVSHVQRLLGESQTRVVEQQNLIQELLTTNEATEPQPVHQQVMIDAQAETIARLNSEIHGLSIQNAELLAQREAVKAELVQERLERNQWQNHAQRTETQLVEKVSECRNLRIELDALQQAPEAEAVAALATSTDDRFEEGLYHGKARAVETIAEWLEPVRLVDHPNLSNETLQHLPQIMRTLTGLADED